MSADNVTSYSYNSSKFMQNNCIKFIQFKIKNVADLAAFFKFLFR